ncbi:MAG: hypothetical protein NXI31_20695 [bacterium]|nr:hypothetical protein [bacterium]
MNFASWLPIACSVALAGCTIGGSGKLPSVAKWTPSRYDTSLTPSPATLQLDGLTIHLTSVTWIREQHYGLFRDPKGCDYEMMIEATCVTDDFQKLGHGLLGTAIMFLDSAADQIRHKGQKTLIFTGPPAADGTYRVSGHHSLGIDSRRPAFFVFGQQRVRLR